MDKEEKRFRDRVKEDVRPWGKFRSYPFRLAGSVKIITVNPGSSLSLQVHNKRSEIWIILDEGLEVTVAGRVWKPQKNEEVFIPKKTPHRLHNKGKDAGRVLEFWLGRSNENDIIRLQDDYGRD